jgi:hypothetical protein
MHRHGSDTIDGFVAWKTKKFLRMNKYLAKIIYEMVATNNSPLKTVSGIYVHTQMLSVKLKVCTR